MSTEVQNVQVQIAKVQSDQVQNIWVQIVQLQNVQVQMATVPENKDTTVYTTHSPHASVRVLIVLTIEMRITEICMG